MSYDIDLINKNTKKILQMKNPAYVRGGTMPAEFNINGDLVQALQTENLSISHTIMLLIIMRLQREILDF